MNKLKLQCLSLIQSKLIPFLFYEANHRVTLLKMEDDLKRIIIGKIKIMLIKKYI